MPDNAHVLCATDDLEALLSIRFEADFGKTGPGMAPRPPRQEIGDGDKTGSALANLRGRLSPARSHKTPRRGLTAKVALIAFAVGWRLVSVPAAPLPSWPGLSQGLSRPSTRGHLKTRPTSAATSSRSYRTRPSGRAARFRSFVAPNRVDGREKSRTSPAMTLLVPPQVPLPTPPTASAIKCQSRTGFQKTKKSAEHFPKQQSVLYVF